MKLSDMSKYKYKTCADLDKEFLTTCTVESLNQRKNIVLANRNKRYSDMQKTCEICGNDVKNSFFTWKEEDNTVVVCKKCYAKMVR